jgi:hypothetical protein
MRRHIEEIERGAEEMAVHAATMPLEQLIRVAIEQNISAHLIDPELHRALSEEVPLAGPTNWKATYTKRMHERVRLLNCAAVKSGCRISISPFTL